ncbi:MAG: porin family protein [Beijerinckiaceae bacterium]|nr:porin family protein [Beijerinckiaceae bacterium]MCI0734778.1 porin family protein [Beijerinckiaceae bacterium]
MMRKFLLLAAFLATAAPAAAADIPSPAPPPAYTPPPLFTWTGFYLGGQIGYAWGTDTVTVFPFGFGTNFTPNGVVGGAHVGYNLQLNQFVAGLEGDVEGTGISRNFSPGGVVYNTNIPVQGSIRARLGITFDRVLLYATGGAAFAGFETTVTGFGIDRTSQTRAGWTVGGGIEYAVTPNWSIRAEYRYADFSSFSHPAPLTFGVGSSVRHQETENAVRAGFSYRFAPIGVPGY